MKSTVAIVVSLAAAVSAHSESPVVLTTAAGSFTTHANSMSTGTWLADFNQTSQPDYLFSHGFAYRMSGDTREYWLSDPGVSVTQSTNTLDATFYKGVGNSSGVPGASLRFDLNYTLTSVGSSPLHQWCMIITNVSAVQVDYSFFAYYDFDIGVGNNAISSHFGIPGGWQSEQINAANPSEFVSTYALGSPDFQHGPIYASIFSNNVIDNLTNTVSPGPGDMAMGFQWSGSLAPGQSSVCPGQGTMINGVVPEPSAAVVLCVGLLALAVRRKRHTASAFEEGTTL